MNSMGIITKTCLLYRTHAKIMFAFFTHLIVTLADAQATHVRKNSDKIWFFTHLIVTLADAQVTHVRKNSNKFGFSLT